MSRAANRLPAREKTRKRQAEFAASVLAGRRAARQDAAEVARTSLRENPNTGKRKHRVTGTVATGPRMSARHRNEPRIELKTYAPGIPSLPPLVTKNIPAGKMRGEITE